MDTCETSSVTAAPCHLPQRGKASEIMRGLDCCIVSCDGGMCPDDCPYSDLQGGVLDCQKALMLDARERIKGLEAELRAKNDG